MYTTRDFKSKKDLVVAVKAGERVTYYQPAGIGTTPSDGTIYVEGPHYPSPHKWYARCEVKDGVVVRVL
jgi:hypothetical protein